MKWQVLFHDDFEAEFFTLPLAVQDDLLVGAKLLQQFGPHLSRSHVDTLQGSLHANMKELRFEAADGVWRIAFAFDGKRQAIPLVAGDKSGGSQKRFYRELIRKAGERFKAHQALAGKGKK